MGRRTLDEEHDREAGESGRAEAPAPDDAHAILAMQRGAGNASVSRMMAGKDGVRTIARWKNLGEESWQIPGLTRRVQKVWVGTKAEWSSRLDNIDDEDEYKDDLWGFLQASNDPSIVGRTLPPRHIASTAEEVSYVNNVTRAPTDAEKLAFLEALYEKSGDLDLWHGGTWEGGPFSRFADQDLSIFLQRNQGLYLTLMAQQGRPVNMGGVAAVAEQGGKAATMAMIVNAGATAHKGVDLVMTANRKQGQERETAHFQAMQLIRNSAHTIQAALTANDARVAFEQAVIGGVFDHVWGLIPGGGLLVDAGKAVLKAGLTKALNDSMADDGPREQSDTLLDEFNATCFSLVSSGQITSADAQDAILSFQSLRR